MTTDQSSRELDALTSTKGPSRLETPRLADLVEVIRVVTVRGAGIASDPIRGVTQYWSKDGGLLAEHDPCCLSEGTAGKTAIPKATGEQT